MDATVDKDTLKKALTMQPPKVECVCERGLAKAELLGNGICRYYQKGTFIRAFYSEGKTADGQVIRTKDASLEGYSCEEGTDKLGAYHRMTARYCHGALRLHQMVTAYDGGELTVQVKLHDTRGKTATRFLAPVVTPYPTWDERTLFLSLDQKMLVVPYDNDMWSRYESAVPAVGKVMMLLRCMMNARRKALCWVRWIFPYGKTPSAGCTTMPAAYRRTAGRRGPAHTMYAPTAWCAANG